MALHDIEKLWQTAQKPSRIIIGLMSGTSLDGLDVALCQVSGSGKATRARVLEFETYTYSEELKEEIRQVFAKKQVDLEKLCLLNEFTGIYHAGLVMQFLEKYKLDKTAIDCIASHGQTVYHAPQRQHRQQGYPNATLQIGDGDHIAVKTGIITLSDFRQKHIAAGGEGAPLALYGDRLLFSSSTENRVLLNIGGIANFTFLPAEDSAGEVLSTDTGPGNTLIDLAAQKFFGKPYDENAAIASSGQVNRLLLDALLQHPFFAAALPKTTGQELFNEDFINEAVQRSGNITISPADLLATLTRLTAESIARAVSGLSKQPFVIYVSGGGSHNPLILKLLAELLPGVTIHDFSMLGLNPDAKEALLFAILANEAIAGQAAAPGYAPMISMGKISLPH